MRRLAGDGGLLRVLITGGGTGGHIYPGLAIAERLRERGDRVLFVGTARGLEKELVPAAGFELRLIPAQSLPRRLSPALLKALWTAGQGFRAARRVLREYRPHVVVGTGGYVAGPVVLAARFMRLPILIQEQNALPGLTNRILARLADRVALGYAEAARRLKARAPVVVTGNPLRAGIAAGDRRAAIRRLGLDPGRATLIAFGASQGARGLNVAMREAAPVFKAHPELQVIHQTGRSAYEAIASELEQRGARRVGPDLVIDGNVRVMPYIDAMPDALAAADLVVGRAGALTISEITACGLPAILIPYPHHADSHQEYNARVLSDAGAALVILEAELSGERLAQAALAILADEKRRRAMGEASRGLGRPNAALAVVKLIDELAAGFWEPRPGTRTGRTT